MDTVTVPGATRLPESVPVVVMRGSEASQSTFKTSAIEDGFFLLRLPLNRDIFQVAVLFGHHYRWVQIESAQLVDNHSQQLIDTWGYVAFDQMLNKGGKLFECLSETGLLIFAPPPKICDNNHLLQIIFRPIVKLDRRLTQLVW